MTLEKQTITTHEAFYALWHPRRGYYVEFDPDWPDVALTTDHLGNDIYSERNSERLKFHQKEYDDRLAGFRMVRVDLTTTKAFNPFPC